MNFEFTIKKKTKNQTFSKDKLNSEKIWNIQKKSKLNSEKDMKNMEENSEKDLENTEEKQVE